MKSKEKQSDYYDSLRKNEWKDAASIGPSSLSRFRIIIKLMKKHNFGGPILDIGCGSGTLLVKIKNAFPGCKLLGSDFSIESVKQSKEKGFTVFQADLSNVNTFSQEIRYKSIICSEVLEHISDDKNAISTLEKLLNHEGMLLITVPYSMKYWSSHDNFSGHVRRYEFQELISKIESNNLKIIDCFIWGGLFYSFYHKILRNTDPKRIMNTKEKKRTVKIIIGRFFYFLFIFDDFFIMLKRGRRIFLVAKKN